MASKRTKQQAGKYAKRKGNAFELSIANQLSKWWGEPRSFRRTPMSGAWNRTVASGDIIAPDSFPFDIECKFQESWDFINFLKNPEKSMLFKFWKQASEECIPSKEPLLVFTRSYQPVFAMLNEGVVLTNKYDGLYHLSCCFTVHVREHAPLFICLFDEFLNKLEPEWYKNDEISDS